MTASLRSEIDTAIMVQIVVWTLGFVWILYRLYPLLIRRRVVPKVGSLQVIGMVFLLALSFSITRSPSLALTGFVIFQGVVMLLFSWIFVQCYGTGLFLHRLFWGYVALCVMIFGAWIFMPSLVMAGGATRVRGDLIAPTGAVSSLAIGLLLSGAVRLRRGFAVPLLILLALLLVVSQTRTSYAGVVIFGLLSFAFRRDAPVRKIVPLVIALLLIAGIANKFHLAEGWIVRENSSVATLSDRIPLWNYMTRIMLRESPFFGLGYYSASRVLGPQYNPALGTGHSVFVEVLVGAGLLGASALLALYVAVVRYVVRLAVHGRHHALTYGLVTLFMLVFLSSLTGTEGIQAGPVGFTFWSLTALLPAVWQEVRTGRVGASSLVPTAVTAERALPSASRLAV